VARFVLISLVCLLLASTTLGQSAPTSEPQALSLAAQSVTALTAGNALTDGTVTATVTRFAGSDAETLVRECLFIVRRTYDEVRRRGWQARRGPATQISLWALGFVIMLTLSCINAKKRDEAELVQVLLTMRAQISDFTLKHGRRPHSLEELVSAGYFERVPVDPMTHRNDTWRLVWGPDGSGAAGSPPGIVEVQSGSDRVKTSDSR